MDIPATAVILQTEGERLHLAGEVIMGTRSASRWIEASFNTFPSLELVGDAEGQDTLWRAGSARTKLFTSTTATPMDTTLWCAVSSTPDATSAPTADTRRLGTLALPREFRFWTRTGNQLHATSTGTSIVSDGSRTQDITHASASVIPATASGCCH